MVVAGPPNVGKSSLINAIAGQERAIVTEVPGTTRDFIEVPLSIAGVPILLTDTAGLRDTFEPVERLGVDRTRSLLDSANILLWMGEPQDAPAANCLIRVHGRFDLQDRQDVPGGSLPVSSISGQGLNSLLVEIARLAQTLLPPEGEVALNRRQAAHVTEVRNALERSTETDDIVLVAENLRGARSALDQLTGRAGMEDVLDALFGRFCLGK